MEKLMQCCVCGEPYVKESIELESGLIRVECERCGLYDIDSALLILPNKNKPWFQVKHFVSAWVRRENKIGITPVIGLDANRAELVSRDWWENRYKHMGFPETTSEKLDALLIALTDSADDNYFVYDPLLELSLIAEVAAKNAKEILGLITILEEIGYLKIESDQYQCRILGKGWLYRDELRKTTKAHNSAFIAMWFHEATKEYREAVIAAIKYCDYKPVILDQEEYNGFIMEQVVSQIKLARFVVADFTCRPEMVENGEVKAGVRGGVYWEAGMAYGLNKPVIHTCEDSEDAKNRRHFDIDQYNTIFWKSADLNTKIRDLSEKIDNPTFAEKLANRILWIVGKGSYIPPEVGESK